jgi:hypothetical protein
VIDLVNQAEPDASFDSCFQSGQHAVRPDRRFHPRPADSQCPPFRLVSSLFSPCGHFRRFVLHRSVPSASTFLHPLARRPVTVLPRRLSPPVATMGALTSAWRPGGPRCSMQISSFHGSGLLDRSVTNHLMARRHRFDTLPLQRAGLPAMAGLGFAHCQQSRQATRPNRVHLGCLATTRVTDQSFTSCCFPPRLATTQLQSVTGRRAIA